MTGRRTTLKNGILRVVRSAIMCAMFFLTASLMSLCSGSSAGVYDNGIFSSVAVWLWIIPTITVVLLCFYNTSRTFWVYEGNYREKYLSCFGGKATVRNRVRFILREPEFWTDAAVISAFSIVACPYWIKQVTEVGLFGGHFGAALAVCCGAIPVLLLMNLFVHISVFHAYAAVRRKKKCDRFGNAPFSERHPTVMFVLTCLRNLLLYPFATIVLPIVLTALAGFVRILFQFPVPVYVAMLSFAAVPFCTSYVRALWKRRNFLRKLERVCSETGYEICCGKNCYRSIFRQTEGANFTLRRGKERYDCRLIAGRKRFVTMAFDADGQGSYIRVFRMRGALFRVRAVSAEIFRIETPFEYSFESENMIGSPAANAKKVLIVNPVPAKMIVRSGAVPRAVDIGSKVGEYTLYNGSGFFGAIERGYLCR